MVNLHFALHLARLDDIELSTRVALKFSGPWCSCPNRPDGAPSGFCGRCRKPCLHFAINLDACREAELKIYRNGFLRYGNILQAVVGVDSKCGGTRNFHLATALPRERCIAMLLSQERSGDDVLTRLCSICDKDVPELQVGSCDICSRLVCGKCEAIMGDMLLCPECNENEVPAEE